MPSLMKWTEPSCPSNDVVLDEGLGLVEDLEVLGGNIDILAIGQGKLAKAFAADLDVEAGAVEEHEVEADLAPQAGEAADPGGPGGAAVAFPGHLEVVRADINSRTGAGTGDLQRQRHFVAQVHPQYRLDLEHVDRTEKPGHERGRRVLVEILRGAH